MISMNEFHHKNLFGCGWKDLGDCKFLQFLSFYQLSQSFDIFCLMKKIELNSDIS